MQTANLKNLQWFNYNYSESTASKKPRVEAAVVHAEFVPLDESTESVNITSSVKRVYATKTPVDTTEYVVQFTEDLSKYNFENSALVVTVFMLDHVSKIAVVESYEYVPNNRIRVRQELVGDPDVNQIEVEYDLMNDIRSYGA